MGKHEIENYKSITPSPILLKIFSELIEQRIIPQLCQNQPKKQAGFRSKFSTINHNHTLRQKSRIQIRSPSCIHWL